VTEVTFGFHTAVQTATEAIDRLRTTAESHHRVMVVEVMGRHAGWIATYAGIAGGATEILIPEEPFSMSGLCERLLAHHDRDVSASIVVVAEGARPEGGEVITQTDQRDAFGHVRLGGISRLVADEIEARTGFETRLTVLGHVQRGGTPTAFDRVLATRFGIAAIDAVHDGRWGQATVLQANEINLAPLADLTGQARLVDRELFETVAGALVALPTNSQ
ncbi:MAG: 6-phosphofructokinase, partial [Chloroflexi bacterium]|nr:6-phosphofructokinase [Chloroflexota bacterium]